VDGQEANWRDLKRSRKQKAARKATAAEKASLAKKLFREVQNTTSSDMRVYEQIARKMRDKLGCKVSKSTVRQRYLKNL